MFKAEKNQLENLQKDYAVLLHDLEEAIQWIEKIVMQCFVAPDEDGIYTHSYTTTGQGLLQYLADIGRMTTEDDVYYRFVDKNPGGDKPDSWTPFTPRECK